MSSITIREAQRKAFLELGYSGFTDAMEKIFWEELPSRVVDNSIVKRVTQASDFDDAQSGVVYVPEGRIDMSGYTVQVPDDTFTVSGYGFDPSQLYSDDDNHIMFANKDGLPAGNLFFSNCSLEQNGTGSQVFDVDNQGNLSAIEFNSVNFLNCASLGTVKEYRQMLFRNNAWINVQQGFNLEESMSGGIALLDSIILFFGPSPSGFKLFSAGTNFSLGGSFRSNLNALNVPSDFVLYDFDKTQVLTDSGSLLDGVRTTGDNIVPNLPSNSVKALYRNCRGLSNTYIGGNWTISTAVATTTPVNTLVKLAGTTSYSELAHFDDNAGTDNSFRYIESGASRDFEVVGVLTFEGSNNRQVVVQIRKWNDSLSQYENVGPEFQSTLNGGASGLRSENTSFAADVTLSENDRVEVWIKNITDSNNVTATLGGLVKIRER